MKLSVLVLSTINKEEKIKIKIKTEMKTMIKENVRSTNTAKWKWKCMSNKQTKTKTNKQNKRNQNAFLQSFIATASHTQIKNEEGKKGFQFYIVKMPFFL